MNKEFFEKLHNLFEEYDTNNSSYSIVVMYPENDHTAIHVSSALHGFQPDLPDEASVREQIGLLINGIEMSAEIIEADVFIYFKDRETGDVYGPGPVEDLMDLVVHLAKQSRNEEE